MAPNLPAIVAISFRKWALQWKESDATKLICYALLHVNGGGCMKLSSKKPCWKVLRSTTKDVWAAKHGCGSTTSAIPHKIFFKPWLETLILKKIQPTIKKSKSLIMQVHKTALLYAHDIKYKVHSTPQCLETSDANLGNVPHVAGW